MAHDCLSHESVRFSLRRLHSFILLPSSITVVYNTSVSPLAPAVMAGGVQTLAILCPADLLTIVALEARPSNELTSEFVASRLLAEEKRSQESFNGKVNTTSESAFIGNYNQAGFNKRRSCWKSLNSLNPPMCNGHMNKSHDQSHELVT